jgi:hypothetical protein
LFLYGNDLSTTIKAALAYPSRQLNWKEPSLPLIPSTLNKVVAGFDITKPASNQYGRTVARVAKDGGCLKELTATDFQRGSAREYTQMDASLFPSANGVPGIGKGTGRLVTAVAHGVTGSYACFIEIPLFKYKSTVKIENSPFAVATFDINERLKYSRHQRQKSEG